MKTHENQNSSQLDLWSTQDDFAWEEYKVAREFVRSLGLGNQAEWESFVNEGNLRDPRIPGEPEKTYQNRGWVDWNDWLGIREPDKNTDPSGTKLSDDSRKDLWAGGKGSGWMNFHEARRTAREFGFEYREEWKLFIDGKFPGRDPLPDNIPQNPDRIYRFIGWKNWKDWLVDPEKQVEYSGFYRAREFVRSCRIGDRDSWRGFLQNNAGMIGEYDFMLPLRPHLEYADSGWESWEDWLGRDINFHDFQATRKFVHSLKLKGKKEWFDFCAGRLPHKPGKSEKVYTYPDVAFKDEGWKNWKDWLGSPLAKNVKAAEAKTSEIMIDCKCKGRISHCPDCDGKGFYTVQLSRG